MTSIPILDFAPFLQGNPSDRQQVARALYQGCCSTGLLYLRRVGLTSEIIAQAFAASRNFFALPLAVKQQVAWSQVSSNRGYIGVARESLDPSCPGDIKEAFNLGQERSPAELAAGRDNPAVQPNPWPDLPQFRPTAMAVYDQFAAAAYRVMRALALALELPEDYFVQRHQSPWFTLRLLHYPPMSQPSSGPGRAGAHTDYGSLTLLVQDGVGGLEVQQRDGHWVAVPAIPDTVIVNVGDLMARWTNGVLRAAPHRVVSPASGGRRYAIAFFCEPDPQVEVRCLPSCRGDRSQYPPITAQDYLMQRLSRTY